ncbi:MAG TPA: MFS transporter [Steroidobacteraceae bacterium]|nr:MFS transporter [Steroidobacteraceae bacterium]
MLSSRAPQPAPGHSSAPTELEARVLAKVRWRLLPFLGLLYFAAFIDRVNVGFAAGQMNRDLALSSEVYGLGAGIFFIGYCIFEVPSNLLLHRVGARRWIARIMLVWALVAGAMACVQGPMGFCALRFALGVAEAGFFPGVIYYLTQWVPAPHRARTVGAFMTAIPLSTAVAGPISSAILGLDGTFGVAGWRWLYVCETAPSLILGVATWCYLCDSPRQARWLTSEEQDWLTGTLEMERSRLPSGASHAVLRALTSSRVLALSVCYFGVELALYGLVLWIPQLLSNLGIPERAVGSVVAIPYGVAAIGMVWWSRRSDRTNERVWHIAIASLIGFAGLAASGYLGRSPVLAVIAIAFGATGTLAILPVFWTLPATVVSGAAAAGAIALINAVGNIGGFVGPYMIGWIKAMTDSFTYGLLVVASGVLVTGVTALLIGPGAQPPRALASLKRRG